MYVYFQLFIQIFIVFLFFISAKKNRFSYFTVIIFLKLCFAFSKFFIIFFGMMALDQLVKIKVSIFRIIFGIKFVWLNLTINLIEGG